MATSTRPLPRHEADPSFRGLIGVGRADMTPPVGIYCHNWGSSKHETATSIHRPLQATAICMRTAADPKPHLIVVMDYCWFIAHRTFEELRAPLLRKFGLDSQQLLLIVTHTHAAPHIDVELESKPGGALIPAFRRLVSDALSNAIDQAMATAEPAILSWATGHSNLARKRDFHDAVSGRILCGPNPDAMADGTLLVGRVTAEHTNRILATLVNYACHPCSLGGGNTAISPDYVGSLRALLEQHTDGAPCLFLHGPSGDQTPRDSYANDPAVADRNGEILGWSALATLRSLLPPSQRLEFVREEKSGADLAIWETRPYAVDGSIDMRVKYLQLPSRQWPTPEQIDADLRAATDGADVVKLNRLRHYVQNLRDGLPNGFPVWALRVGQCIFIATPAEPFVLLQTRLRAWFPALAIIVMNDTNGSFNYLPPRDYYGNGAYEQESADFGAGSLEIVIDAAADLITALTGATRERGVA